ncbi:MAG: hypothetical protein ABIP68_01880 [Ferruginibacter sp.]
MKQVFFLALVVFLITSCKKTPPQKTETTVYLRDKSLMEIKKEVLGNWKIHYSYGGITGNTKTQMTNSFFSVKQNDSIYLTLSNILFAKDIATFQRVNTNFGYSAFTMDFSSIGGTPYSWIVDYKIRDTLVLVDNFPNAQGYYMTKIP